MTLEELTKLQKLLEKAAQEAWDVYYENYFMQKDFKANQAFKVYEALDTASATLSLRKGYIAKGQ